MNAWLATVVGDTAAPIVGFVLLFALVIVLLLLVFGVLRRVTGGTFVNGGRNRQVRLSVTDAAAVDNRRRLVLVRRDDVEHLILIGGPSDVVIEQNIRQFAKQQSRIEPAAPTIAERETKPEAAAIETPREQPAPRAAPQTQQQPPARGPAASPQPPSAPRPPEPARQQAAPAPLPPIPPITPVPASEPVRTPAYFPAATETPLA
ncbi:MAG: flagellar biosynthetic protein FliO, partial [Alphaproteobacteria bacterium]